jgi:hypothetical protein
LLKNAIRHATENHGLTEEDRIIVAGDLVDIGHDWRRVIEDVEQVGAEVLWGNHDVAAVIGQRISPQDLTVSGYVVQETAERMGWKLAAEHAGVLITHAGLSVLYAEKLGIDTRDAKVIAERLNREFESQDGMKALAKLPYGTLWFRPFDRQAYGVKEQMPYRVPQVAGHTPLEYYDKSEQLAFDQMDFTLVDMYVRYNFGREGHAVYAIIDENGNVERVVT